MSDSQSFWKSLKVESIDSLKSNASLYIRALITHQQWNVVLESIQDASFTYFVNASLKKRFVRCNVFNNISVQSVISFLDSSNDILRERILHILI